MGRFELPASRPRTERSGQAELHPVCRVSWFWSLFLRVLVQQKGRPVGRPRLYCLGSGCLSAAAPSVAEGFMLGEARERCFQAWRDNGIAAVMAVPAGHLSEACVHCQITIAARRALHQLSLKNQGPRYRGRSAGPRAPAARSRSIHPAAPRSRPRGYVDVPWRSLLGQKSRLSCS